MNLPKSPLQIKIIHEQAGFEKLQADWTYLHSKCATRDAVLTWEWMFAWWKHHNQDRSLHLVTVWRNEQLVGVAPLMIILIRKYGFKFRILCNIGSPYPDIGSFLYQPDDFEVIEAIINKLFEEKGKWDILELNSFPENAQDYSHIKSFFVSKGFQAKEEADTHFVVPIDLTWDQYIEKLPTKFKKNLRRNIKRIQETGKVGFQRYSGNEIQWDHLQTLFNINEYGHYPDIYHDENEIDFQREILRLMAKPGWIEIHFLSLNDVPIAYRYGFVFEKRFEGWRNGFDSRYNTYSPGKVLLYFALEDKFNRNFSEFDFLLGAERHKEQWNTISKIYYQVRIVPSMRSDIKSWVTFILLPKVRKYLEGFLKKEPTNHPDE